MTLEGWTVLRQPTTGMESDCAPASRDVVELPDRPHVMAKPVETQSGSWVVECLACGIRLARS